MSYVYNKNQYGCPVSCKYCVITKVDSRRELWNKKTLIGLNKAVTVFNPPYDLADKDAVYGFYNFPLELLEGDYVGFNAISDPFWGKYRNELNYFLSNVSPIAKLITCVTKYPISDKIFEQLAQFKNFRLVVSITGLDSIEKSNTESRLLNLKKAKEYGVKAFPLCHPYIEGLSDLSFLPKLKDLGYDRIDIKGLRYNHDNMKDWMPKESQSYYINSNEAEILPDVTWKEKVKDAGLSITSLKDWYKEDNILYPKLDLNKATNNTYALLEFGNITSSDTSDAVIDAAIKRRL